MNAINLVPPTPSPSLNGALLAMCRVTYRNDLSAAQYQEKAAIIVRSYEPETTGAGLLSVEEFLSWFDNLSADEYLALAGAPVETTNKGAMWE
jgi:hypothetical protein